MDRRAYDREDPQGEALVRIVLREIEEDEHLSRQVGVDLTPPAPSRSHAPVGVPPLQEWLRRSEEVHAFLASRARR